MTVVAACSALVLRSGPQVSAGVRTSTRQSTSMKLFDWKRREADESGLIRYDSQEFKMDNIRGAPGSTHRKMRKGRGISAGKGATCGFGMRGQKSRSGRPTRAGFEGGQTPLYRRLPKLVGRRPGPGHSYEVFSLVQLPQLSGVAEGAEVDFDALLELGAVTKAKQDIIKVVGGKAGEEVTIPKGIKVKAHAFTSSARSAIEAAGGECIMLSKTTQEVIAA